ncbi:hypothetical protein LG288_11105 [Idiomarina seosinensis]|uniref:hypothetical protein n=1 Tax=Idiomarina seosinensis TaxID=281739 RepID=UPI00384EFC7D
MKNKQLGRFICLVLSLMAYVNAPTIAKPLPIVHTLCPEITTEVVHPMQLGSLQLRSGDTGWVYLDGAGELFVSSNISKNPTFPASNGLIRLRGPAQHRIHLELAYATDNLSAENDKFLQVNSIRLFASQTTEVRHVVNDQYEVVLPASPNSDAIEIELQLGLEAQVRTTNVPQKLTTSVQLRCLSVAER